MLPPALRTNRYHTCLIYFRPTDRYILFAMQDISRTLHKILGLLERLEKQISKPIRLWLVTIGPDEKMKGQQHMKVTLTKPLKPGFRRPLTITPDEDVDQRADGSFAEVTTLEGDSTGTIDPSSTAKQIKAFVNGDGALGTKVVQIKTDGHIGEGDVEVTVDIEYTVAHPDATELKVVEAGADEPIPTPPPTP